MAKKKSIARRKNARGKADGMPKVRVRMYRQGLGDCFLLTFNTGPKPVHMLVDCGTLGATTTGVKIKDVVKDIAAETESHIHLLVVTHEHKDHVSGFGSEQEQFDDIGVDRVWVAWTENPHDALAQKIEKFKHDLLESLALGSQALLTNQAADSDEKKSLHAVAAKVRELLAFAGTVPEGEAPLGADFAKTVDAAMTYASMKTGSMPEFLRPGRVFEPSWLPGVRFYVLGPPRSEKAIANLGEHGSPELYEVTARFSHTLAGCARFFASDRPYQAYRDALSPSERAAFESEQPFDARFRIETSDREACARHLARYEDPTAAWRRIDYDWLAGADDLALQLDNATNNTSLALAVELIADGRVLLLPADAQLGNWLSWENVEFTISENGSQKTVTTADLLKRTVLYKVGHHSSHNATIRQKGLELMERDDLIALIPVDSSVADNKGWTMPAPALYRRLIEKTRGRVLRSDTGWPKDSDRPAVISKAEWDAARAQANVAIGPLFIDVNID